MGEPSWRKSQTASVLGYCTESLARVQSRVGWLALSFNWHASSSQATSLWSILLWWYLDTLWYPCLLEASWLRTDSLEICLKPICSAGKMCKCKFITQGHIHPLQEYSQDEGLHSAFWIIFCLFVYCFFGLVWFFSVFCKAILSLYDPN